MNIDQVRAHCNSIDKAAANRYANRAAKRDAMLQEVERVGVFAAAGMPAAIRRAAHMSIAEGRAMASRTYEAVIGSDDSDPVNFLARGFRAARCVCRLTSNGQAVGTGFLVAPGLLLTNNHVIPSAEEADSFRAEFDYELDEADQPRTPVVRFRLQPERLFATSDADNGLDFTFVSVAPMSEVGAAALAAFGWIPLDPRVDKILVGEPAVIIQHPRGDPKRVAVFAAELADKFDDFLHYTTDTDHGSSGSCVMNRSWQLVALHHAATVSDRKRRGRQIVVNEGVRISAILDALNTRKRVSGSADAVLSVVSRPDVIGDGRPQAPAAPVAPLAPSAGRTTNREAAPTLRLEATRIRVQPDGHFENRDNAHSGYKPAFLGAKASVPLPRLPDFLADDAAQLADGTTELKYTHYSVVHSASRRLPILTAVNIDGALSRRLGRKDRDFEAADTWYYDPRIPRDLQLKPEIYDRTDFDFGHMVRREDPVWGDQNTSRMANDDTFYMTNCVPQHSNLNQRTWLKLEDAALNSARSAKRKISVFTGPVLSPQDPRVLGVQVPTAFWKIVAYVERGKLRAHGFMQFQTKLVRDIRIRPEALTQLDDVEEYQVSIKQIARATALDFGALIAADVAPGRGGPESVRLLDDNLIDAIFPTAPDDDDQASRDEEPAASTPAIAPRAPIATPTSNGASLEIPPDAIVILTKARDLLTNMISNH